MEKSYTEKELEKENASLREELAVKDLVISALRERYDGVEEREGWESAEGMNAALLPTESTRVDLSPLVEKMTAEEIRVSVDWRVGEIYELSDEFEGAALLGFGDNESKVRCHGRIDGTMAVHGAQQLAKALFPTAVQMARFLVPLIEDFALKHMQGADSQ